MKTTAEKIFEMIRNPETSEQHAYELYREYLNTPQSDAKNIYAHHFGSCASEYSYRFAAGIFYNEPALVEREVELAVSALYIDAFVSGDEPIGDTSFRLAWEELLRRGIYLLHGMKCPQEWEEFSDLFLSSEDQSAQLSIFEPPLKVLAAAMYQSLNAHKVEELEDESIATSVKFSWSKFIRLNEAYRKASKGEQLVE